MIVMVQRQEEERRVVPFAVPPGRARRRLIQDATGTGAILLFTGVRYEREANPGNAAARSGAPDPRLRS